MQPLNIQIFVDVIALLLGNSPESTVFAFDDSPFGNPKNGTPELQSAVWPGQLVRWTVTAVDVQTPVWISDLSFGDPLALEGVLPGPQTATPWAENWEGYVPAFGLYPGSRYPYALTLRFGAMTSHRVVIEGLALGFMPQLSPRPAPASSVAVPDGVV